MSVGAGSVNVTLTRFTHPNGVPTPIDTNIIALSPGGWQTMVMRAGSVQARYAGTHTLREALLQARSHYR
ncbi:hypothetical protein [Actinocorallia lasiicapitis]